LWEEHKLQVFEKKMFRIMFGSEKDEVSEQFRILCIGVLCDMYGSPGIVRIVKAREL
jgi:hypothetical protein